MTKLHELLAVESSLENQANKLSADLTNSFEKKGHLFTEKRVVFTSSEEGKGEPVIESQSDIQTTVQKELGLLKDYLAKSWDAGLQVAVANTKAQADIQLENGEVVATGIPATALLELEKRLISVQNLINATPTLDPAKGFQPDEQRGAGYYKGRTINKNRTRKDKKVVVLYPPTVEHPAQTQLIEADVFVGKIEEQEWSSALTPAKKSELLNNVEGMVRAVKRARIRANEQEVDVKRKIGDAILGRIFTF
jgi:hypothetical protein